jgi:hypothetical protein
VFLGGVFIAMIATTCDTAVHSRSAATKFAEAGINTWIQQLI